MAEAKAQKDWFEPVVAFFKDTLPKGDPDGWADLASTSYQVGCDALVALGQAESTAGGAVPLSEPFRPAPLPRWDDIATAVLWLMGQNNLLAYRNLDGSVYQRPVRAGGMSVFRVVQKDAPAPPQPNIAAAHGLGPAFAKEECIEVLSSLSLIYEGAWSRAAEPVLWRGSPAAWNICFDSDPRFVKALDACVATLPGETAEQIAELSMVSASELTRQEDLWKANAAMFKARRLSAGSAEIDQDKLKRSCAFGNANQIDWLFFSGWRLDGGWMDKVERGRAISIFHDRLAIKMRRAVMRRLHPTSDVVICERAHA